MKENLIGTSSAPFVEFWRGEVRWSEAKSAVTNFFGFAGVDDEGGEKNEEAEEEELLKNLTFFVGASPFSSPLGRSATTSVRGRY